MSASHRMNLGTLRKTYPDNLAMLRKSFVYGKISSTKERLKLKEELPEFYYVFVIKVPQMPDICIFLILNFFYSNFLTLIMP